jgi:hypothetical protein
MDDHIDLALVHCDRNALDYFGREAELAQLSLYLHRGIACGGKVTAVYIEMKMQSFGQRLISFRVNVGGCDGKLRAAEPVIVKNTAGFKHTQARGKKNDSRVLRKLDHIGRGAFVAHEDDAVHIHHDRRLDDLRINEAGKKHRLIFYERQNVAHHIASASGYNVAVEMLLAAKKLGIK